MELQLRAVGASWMQNNVLAAIGSEKILQSKLSVIVTEECVAIPSFGGQPHTVLSLSCICKIKVIKTFHPSLLVISVGLFLLSAAAMSSKDGAGTGMPMGVLGIVFLVGFLISQRARLVFMIGNEASQTMNGSFAEVADLLEAVEVARRNLLNTGSEKLLTPGLLTRVKQFVNGLMGPRIRTCVM